MKLNNHTISNLGNSSKVPDDTPDAKWKPEQRFIDWAKGAKTGDEFTDWTNDVRLEEEAKDLFLADLHIADDFEHWVRLQQIEAKYGRTGPDNDSD